MYKSAEDISVGVLLKLAGIPASEVNPGVLRKLYRYLFGHGHEDEILRAKMGVPPKAPDAPVAPAAETGPVVTVGGTATGNAAKPKEGMGLLGILGMAGLGAGGGYMLANSKSKEEAAGPEGSYPAM